MVPRAIDFSSEIALMACYTLPVDRIVSAVLVIRLRGDTVAISNSIALKFVAYVRTNHAYFGIKNSRECRRNVDTRFDSIFAAAIIKTRRKSARFSFVAFRRISIFFLAICTRRCGSLGRCIRPNICLCEGGTVASSCSSSQTKGEQVVFRLLKI